MLSLAKPIVSIVTNNRKNRLGKLKEHLLYREYSQHIIDYSIIKIFHPKFQTENNINIRFIRAYNPNHDHSCLHRIKKKQLKTCFQKKNVLLSTRQPLNLCKLFTTANVQRLTIPKQIKQAGFFPWVTASIIKMVIFKNVLRFPSNLNNFLT